MFYDFKEKFNNELNNFFVKNNLTLISEDIRPFIPFVKFIISNGLSFPENIYPFKDTVYQLFNLQEWEKSNGSYETLHFSIRTLSRGKIKISISSLINISLNHGKHNTSLNLNVFPEKNGTHNIVENILYKLQVREKIYSKEIFYKMVQNEPLRMARFIEEFLIYDSSISSKPISREEKVAILIVSLPPEQGALILKHIKQRYIEIICSEIAKLSSKLLELKHTVIDEFLIFFNNFSYLKHKIMPSINMSLNYNHSSLPSLISFPLEQFFLTVLFCNNSTFIFFSLTKGVNMEFPLVIFSDYDHNLFLVKKNLPDFQDFEKISGKLFKREKQEEDMIFEIKEISHISVEVGFNLVSLIDPKIESLPLFEFVKKFKEGLSEKFIFTPPGVYFKDNLTLGKNEYLIKIKDCNVYKGKIFKEKLLVTGTEKELKEIEVPQEQADGLYGLPALWINRQDREIAERYGLLIMEAEEVLSLHIEEVYVNNLYRFFGLADMEFLLDNFLDKYPDEIVFIRNNIKLWEIWKIFKYLIKEDIPFYSMETILSHICKIWKKKLPLRDIYEILRKDLLPGVFHLYNADITSCYQLSPGMEEFIISINKGFLSYNDLNFREKFYKEILRLLYIDKIKRNIIILCSRDVRFFILSLVKDVFPSIKIFSYDELPQEIKLNVEGEFHIDYEGKYNI